MSIPLTFFGYALSLILETVFLVFGIRHLWRHPLRAPKHLELYYLCAIVLCYGLNVLEKLVPQGADAKWFYLIHPLGNLSPFLFTMAFFAILLPERDRVVFRTVAGIMCLAMIGAGYYNSLTRLFMAEPWLYTCIVFDNFGHILFGLYGFYILRNRVVIYDRKTKIFSCSFVLGTALLMLILNAIFGTSFFGLNLYGNHNIYNLVLTKSSALSAVLYFIGLSGLLAIGWHFADVIQKKASQKDGKEGEIRYARV